ncbi:MAG: hypothetical protein F6J96_34840 [Symploca sp. SIO1C2]|nr:hypothetical protein [Symploca sp. SIO1C2]
MSSVALTPEQVVAANALANGLPVNEVAKLVGVSKRTVLRWKKTEAFQAELRQGRNSVAMTSVEVIRESRESNLRNSENRLSSLINKSFDVLEEVISNPEESTRSRLKAIETVGIWAGLKYMNEINTAIELIERRGFKVIVDDLNHLADEANWESHKLP